MACRFILILGLTLSLTSCYFSTHESLLSDPSKTATPPAAAANPDTYPKPWKAVEPASVEIKELKKGPKDSQPEQGIEISWLVPEKPVEGFIVFWGAKPDALSNQMRISTHELETVVDPVRGPLFKCTIPSKSTQDDTSFVSIAAFSGDATSDPSPPLEVEK